MKLKGKEKQQLFSLLQQAFFVNPEKNTGDYVCEGTGDRLEVRWDIESDFNWQQAPAALRKKLGQDLPAPGTRGRFGSEHITLVKEDGAWVVRTENCRLNVEPAFDYFRDDDREILAILAARCVDYRVVRERICACLGLEDSAGLRLRFVPKDVLGLRVLINSRNVPLGDIETGHLTDMTYAFSIYMANEVQENPRKDFSGIEKWDTSKVTNMTGVFAGCVNFNHDISGWDMSNVTRTDVMFASCRRFNQPIGRWNMSRVTSIKGMFYKCQEFDQDLSGWDVSHVKDMSYTFFKCSRYSRDLSMWKTAAVEQDTATFMECPLDEEKKPASPNTDFKRQYYERYVGPRAAAYARKELFKKVGLMLGFGILVLCFATFFAAGGGS